MSRVKMKDAGSRSNSLQYTKVLGSQVKDEGHWASAMQSVIASVQVPRIGWWLAQPAGGSHWNVMMVLSSPESVVWPET